MNIFDDDSSSPKDPVQKQAANFIPDPSKGVEMFSKAKVELMREVSRSDELAEIMWQAGITAASDWGDILAEITAYCNVAMDGLYSQEDLEHLYPQLVHRLQKRSTPIMMANDAPIVPRVLTLTDKQ